MITFDPTKFGGAKVFTWNKDYLFQVLTSGKKPPISSPKVALAFRKLDRKDFVPLEFRDSAYMDVDLDIGYGEKFTRPTVLGQMASLMNIRYGGNYLDIGTGTGFFACVIAFIAGQEGNVYSLERIQWLWEYARGVYGRYKEICPNVTFLYRDGMEGLPQKAPFDGIHVSFAMEDVPVNLRNQLSINGKMIMPTTDGNLRLVTRLDSDNFEEEIIPGFVFSQGKVGVA